MLEISSSGFSTGKKKYQGTQDICTIKSLDLRLSLGGTLSLGGLVGFDIVVGFQRVGPCQIPEISGNRKFNGPVALHHSAAASCEAGMKLFRDRVLHATHRLTPKKPFAD